jgi:hypothetical protein
LRKTGFALTIALALVGGLTAETAAAQRRRWANPGLPRMVLAQKRGGQGSRGNRPAQQFRPGGGNGQGQPNVRGMAGLPPKWVDNLRDMSPEEQERFMQNNERFQNLPPERQAQIRQNLQKWNQLSPTERNAIRDREYMWEHMSPKQRQYVQGVLLPRWQQMPPERRQLINGRLHTLQSMTPAQREAALNDPQFMQGLSPDEQSMLRDLNSLRNSANW